MVDILAGIGVIALVIGAGIFVNYMEGIGDKKKQDRLEEFYRDEFGHYRWEDDDEI